MPNRKEIEWSQLKVGALVMVGCAVVVSLIFLMNASTGGFLAHKVSLRSYFPNAAGIKVGSPVTLEGVTIGNVIHVRVIAARNPTPVEVTMQIGDRFLRDIHTDSTSSIGTAGVLGDSYIDIDSTRASGPMPRDNAELQTTGAPTIQSVISSSQVSIEEINTLMKKIEKLVDSLNSTRGTIGEIINDPVLAKKIVSIANDLQTVSGALAQGKGSLGQLINDNTLYTKLSTATDQLSAITTDLNAGKGSAGKLLKDDSLYNNLNATVADAHQLVASINQGNGALGKFAKDPAFAQKLDDAVTNLDSLLKGINAGEGTAGQLVKNRSLYDHLDQTMDEAHQLVKGMRENPKKYLVIQLKLF